MHQDYLIKIRKSLNSYKQLVPTHFETFYCVLKESCNSITKSDITPEILDKLSVIYGFCKNIGNNDLTD